MSPSASEIIRKKLSEQEADKRVEEQRRKDSLLHQRQEQEGRSRQYAQEEEARKARNRSVSERVFSQSNVLNGMQNIAVELLKGNVAKYAIVKNYDYARILLVWGTKFSVHGGNIDFEDARGLGYLVGFSFLKGEKDYSYISVGVAPDSETLFFGHKEIPSDVWKNDKQMVADQLAYEFMNPKHVKENDFRKSDVSFSDSGKGTECY